MHTVGAICSFDLVEGFPDCLPSCLALCSTFISSCFTGFVLQFYRGNSVRFVPGCVTGVGEF